MAEYPTQEEIVVHLEKSGLTASESLGLKIPYLGAKLASLARPDLTASEYEQLPRSWRETLFARCIRAAFLLRWRIALRFQRKILFDRSLRSPVDGLPNVKLRGAPLLARPTRM